MYAGRLGAIVHADYLLSILPYRFSYNALAEFWFKICVLVGCALKSFKGKVGIWGLLKVSSSLVVIGVDPKEEVSQLYGNGRGRGTEKYLFSFRSDTLEDVKVGDDDDDDDDDLFKSARGLEPEPAKVQNHKERLAGLS